jgi:Uma2 family endonuclease
MLKSKFKPMTADEFLLWNLDQEDKYELVDGYPVLLHEPINGQVGATRNHDRIVVNLIGTLHRRLRGGPCTPSTSDQAVRTSITKVRRPDVTIECGSGPSSALESIQPVVVFEVSSPSNRPGPTAKKIDEYRHHGTIRHIVLVEQDVIGIVVLSRGADGDWTVSNFDELDQTLRFDAPSVELPLTEIYEGVPLTPDVPTAPTE